MPTSNLPPATDDTARDAAWLTAASLSFAALVFAAVLVPVRDRLDNANVALVLMGLVVLAGVLAGRRPALCVAAVGGLAFNFFHTRPYGTLKMSNGNDIVVAVLLAACGLAVGEIAANRAARALESGRRMADVDALVRLAAVAAEDDLVRTWARARGEIERALRTPTVWFEPADTVSASAALPHLSATGVRGSRVHRWAGDGFALPEEGVQIQVGGGVCHHRIVVHAPVRRTVTPGAYSFVAAVAGVLALAIDRQPGQVGALVEG